jgi:hypothetical protein
MIDAAPAYRIAPGTLVRRPDEDSATLFLKTERIGKEHTNHFLVPLEPPPAQGTMGLTYIDPETLLVAVEGMALAFEDGPERTEPDFGDAFANRAGIMLKVRDDAKSQRLQAYVDLATGLIRPRMEHGITRLMRWRVERL